MLDRIPTPLYSAAAVAVSLTGLLLLAGVGSPGPDGAADVPDGSVLEAERGAAASGDGSAEGIKVHGHWTIEVREPDGRVVTRKEFQNALLERGEVFLAGVIAGVIQVDSWAVFLSGDPAPCTSSPVDRCSGFASISAPDNELILTMSVIAQRDGNISLVSTLVASCADPVPPACAQVFEHFPFSATSIQPVAVLEGQLISATVRIGFSS